MTVETSINGRLDSVVTLNFNFNQPVKRLITSRRVNPGTTNEWVQYCSRLSGSAINPNCIGSFDTRSSSIYYYIGTAPDDIIRPAMGDFDSLAGLWQITNSLSWAWNKMFTVHIGATLGWKTFTYRGYMYRLVGG